MQRIERFLQRQQLLCHSQRYARGEIDGTTFDQMRERLEASGRSSRQS